MKKILCLTLASLTVATAIFPVVTNAIGGWDEIEGNFSTEILLDRKPKHQGHRETSVINGNSAYRARGWTTWSKVYHYTTARMERYGGTVLTTSGRKYGTGYSEAVSPWYRITHAEDSAIARTYYGRG